jgi:hypothetical protein
LRRAIGVVLIVLAFVLPLWLVPMLPDRALVAIAFGYGFVGTPFLVLMIQGVRMFNGDE